LFLLVARVGPTTPTRAGRLADASVDPTDARNDILGCFGRSDRSALRYIDVNRIRSVTRLSRRGKIPARQPGRTHRQELRPRPPCRKSLRRMTLASNTGAVEMT
jgi:hypothetical protein